MRRKKANAAVGYEVGAGDRSGGAAGDGHILDESIHEEGVGEATVYLRSLALANYLRRGESLIGMEEISYITQELYTLQAA